MCKCLTMFVSLLIGAPVIAAVRLPAIISENMVLQRSTQTPMWGTADPGETVNISFKSQGARAVADAKGRWRAVMDLAREDTTAGDLVVQGANVTTLHNVVVGEVWLCSGQSNMSFTVDQSSYANREAKNFPMIRQFLVPQVIALEPRTETAGQWVIATPNATGSFTAVGFFFAREVYQKTGRPVGLINASWGGTGAEAWTSEPLMTSDPELRSMFEKCRSAMVGPTDAARKLRNDPSMPSVLYDGMIAPLLPYRIRGTLWYQGEGNELRWPAYEKLLTSMITGWRKDWGLGDFPFYIVQLAGFREKPTSPSAESGWVQIRYAQARVASNLPNCGLVTAIDIGDVMKIHPTNKQEVGHRLAALALAKEYGVAGEYTGPTFEHMEITGNEARLTFSHADGLTARGGAVDGFALAGADGTFVWAQAKIEGHQVVVWSDAVTKPVQVRYGWSNNPNVTLYNRAGFPAFPFEATYH